MPSPTSLPLAALPSADPSLSLRLYLVIRSGCAGLSAALACADCWPVEFPFPLPLFPAPGGGGGWNVSGGYTTAVSMHQHHHHHPCLPAIFWMGEPKETLTVSILPARIRSVVAAIFTPFRCRSQSTVRRSTWGNICWILSAAASRARIATNAASAPPLCCDRPPAAAVPAGDAKKRYRIIRPDKTRITTRDGRLTCSLVMASLEKY